MDLTGNACSWADLFPDKLIPDILQLVIDAWNALPSPKPTELEVPITQSLLHVLRRINHTRSEELPFRIHVELAVFPSDGEHKGRVDLIFEPVNTLREEVYFAFECKRLRVRYKDRIHSLAGEYIGDDGMMCFVGGKYACGLRTGGMIGYVMDGCVEVAIESIKGQIERERQRLCLKPGKSLERSSCLPEVCIAKESIHVLHGGDFAIHHLFLGTSN